MSRTKHTRRMIRAAATGQSAAVRNLVEGGMEVDAQDRHGNRAITLAAQAGHLEVVRLLVEYGAEINEADGLGRSPLMAAAQGDHMEVLVFLVAAGADVNAGGGEGRTALMECASSDAVDAARRLLELGADVNQPSQSGVTALHEAVFSACEDYQEPADNEMVPLLVDAGADLHAADADGVTPLELARQYVDEIDYTELLTGRFEVPDEAVAVAAMQEIVDQAVDSGAEAVTIELAKEGGLEVVFMFGNTGVGGVLVDRSLEGEVMTLIHERAGLEREPTGVLVWESRGRKLKIGVKEYDNFGETAYTLSFKRTRSGRSSRAS